MTSASKRVQNMSCARLSDLTTLFCALSHCIIHAINKAQFATRSGPSPPIKSTRKMLWTPCRHQKPRAYMQPLRQKVESLNLQTSRRKNHLKTVSVVSPPIAMRPFYLRGVTYRYLVLIVQYRVQYILVTNAAFRKTSIFRIKSNGWWRPCCNIVTFVAVACH